MKKVTKKTVRNTAPQAPGGTKVPQQILLADALKGVPFGDETLLAFYINDVEVERDFYMSKGRVIPRLLLTVQRRVTVEIYGSHMEPADLGLTHMVHNPKNIRIKHVPEFGLDWPSWVYYLDNLRDVELKLGGIFHIDFKCLRKAKNYHLVKGYVIPLREAIMKGEDIRKYWSIKI